MKELYGRVYGTNYTASGKANRVGDLLLKVETPREVLERINAGELAPAEFLHDKETAEYAFNVYEDELPLCDFLREMFEEKGINLSLCQVMDIWNAHSIDLNANWLNWDGTSFDELNTIRNDLTSGVRSSIFRENPWGKS